VLVGNVHDQLPTEASKLGNGEAPDEAFGLPYGLGLIPKLGAPAYLRIDGDKGDDANEMLIVLGYNHDGTGIRVLCQDGSIVTGVHVRLNPDDTAFNDAQGCPYGDPTKAKPFLREHFNLNGGLLDLRLAAGGQLEDLAAPEGRQLSRRASCRSATHRTTAARAARSTHRRPRSQWRWWRRRARKTVRGGSCPTRTPTRSSPVRGRRDSCCVGSRLSP